MSVEMIKDFVMHRVNRIGFNWIGSRSADSIQSVEEKQS